MKGVFKPRAPEVMTGTMTDEELQARIAFALEMAKRICKRDRELLDRLALDD